MILVVNSLSIFVKQYLILIILLFVCDNVLLHSLILHNIHLLLDQISVELICTFMVGQSKILYAFLTHILFRPNIRSNTIL